MKITELKLDAKLFKRFELDYSKGFNGDFDYSLLDSVEAESVVEVKVIIKDSELHLLDTVGIRQYLISKGASYVRPIIPTIITSKQNKMKIESFEDYDKLIEKYVKDNNPGVSKKKVVEKAYEIINQVTGNDYKVKSKIVRVKKKK